ncbi:MAG: hypothetical protein NC913_08705, partial [Candidatus Omnitrophica bacterium]|nr:hypothetical protein [Candidatus Omnitrophota bacterium]
QKSDCESVFTIGEDAKIIAHLCGRKSKHFEDIYQLAEYVSHFVERGDIILVKGSRINKLDIVVQKLIEKLGK